MNDKERAVTRLRELEAEQRALVAAGRERVDAWRGGRRTIAAVIAAEARADAFAIARDVVEGVPYWNEWDLLAQRGWTVTDRGCWEWNGTRRDDGYGVIRIRRVLRRVHRVAFAAVHGPIPVGMIVRHSCDNSPCMNPDHLLIGTVADNSRDALERGLHQSGATLERCSRGHPYTPENTRVTPRGRRVCRTCHRITEREARLHGRRR